MLGAPPLGFCAIAAVALWLLLASDSAPATLKSKLNGISEPIWSLMIDVGEVTARSPRSIAAISAGRPAMDEAIVELLVVSDVASTRTEPFIRLAVSVPSDAPSVAVADVVMSLMANAPPTAPLAPVPGAATDVALVEKELLLIARTFSVLPLVFTRPAAICAPVATLAVVDTDPLE
ncbi:hypothetical protein ACVIHC_008531 [Bradyrhizobium diazoefficiens]